MNADVPFVLTTQQLAKFGALFGPPPTLSTEDVKSFEEMWEQFLECFMPKDFLEVILIRQVLIETWKIWRYTRHQGIGIERRFRQSLKFQIQRKKEQKACREALAKELAEKTGRPITDFDRLMHLEAEIEGSVPDVDEIVQRTPTELAHNAALEAGIKFEGDLDRLINSSATRRANAVQQLNHYRSGLGEYWQQIAFQIIHREVAAERDECEPRGPKYYSGQYPRASDLKKPASPQAELPSDRQLPVQNGENPGESA